MDGTNTNVMHYDGYRLYSLSLRPVPYISIIYQPFRKFDRMSDHFVGAAGRDATGLYERLVLNVRNKGTKLNNQKVSTLCIDWFFDRDHRRHGENQHGCFFCHRNTCILDANHAIIDIAYTHIIQIPSAST